MAEIVFKEESYRIIGSCLAVYNKLGSGFLESVYQEALEIQFNKDKIPFEKEKKLRIKFDDKQLDKFFKADYVCFDSIIVELKATPFIHKNDIAQVLNYLRATDMRLGILVNFGEKSLTYKRVINSHSSQNSH
ncbi:MAG: GxxExxY protein [Bacteroidales bacterium]|nr:GxxExxY protein [Bacteroidales bacterium]